MPGSFNNATIDQYAADLKAYWAMEETGVANRIDFVGSNDLVPTNTPGTRAGINNNACDYVRASSQYLSVADSVDLSPTTSLCVSLWLYMDAIETRVGIFSKGSDGFYLLYLSANKLFWRMFQSDNAEKDMQGITIASGGWHNLLAMADGSFMRIYLDGSEEGTPTAYDGTIKDNASAFEVGAEVTSNFIDGGIDEVAFWNGITFADGAARLAFAAALWNSGSGSFYGLAQSALTRDVGGVLDRTAAGVLVRAEI